MRLPLVAPTSCEDCWTAREYARRLKVRALPRRPSWALDIWVVGANFGKDIFCRQHRAS